MMPEPCPLVPDWGNIIAMRAPSLRSFAALLSLSSLGLAAPVESAEVLSRTNLLQFISDGRVQPVRSTNDWQLRRADILRAMQDVMGPLPGAEKRGALDVRVEEETDAGDYLRRFLTYAAEPGGRVPAYLLIPKRALNSTRQFPAVLGLHQTHPLGQRVVVGLGQSTNDEYGVELVRRGYVVLAPAYPLLANYQPDVQALGYASGTMKAIWDNVRSADTTPFTPPCSMSGFKSSSPVAASTPIATTRTETSPAGPASATCRVSSPTRRIVTRSTSMNSSVRSLRAPCM
jgi:hypothetical protein